MVVNKNNGTARLIFIPPDPLKAVQRKINNELRGHFPARDFADMFGILEKTSNVKHARVHAEAKYVLQFDLKSAFPSVTAQQLEKVLYALFWEQRDDLAASYDFDNGNDDAIWTVVKKQWLVGKLTQIIVDLCTTKGILPQGTPSAPFLFHLVIAHGLFDELKNVCARLAGYHAKLTIYFDNIVISSSKPLPAIIRNQITDTILASGFEINGRKTRSTSFRSTAPLITGLRIVNGRVSLPRDTINKWRGLLHSAASDCKLWPEAQGILAYLLQVYGRRLDNYPGPLRQPIREFKNVVRGSWLSGLEERDNTDPI